MAEKVFSKDQTNGCTVKFKYDDVTLKVTKCTVSGLPSGKKIIASVKDDDSNSWSRTFTTNTTKTVTPEMSFNSSELDGIVAESAYRKA